MLPTSPIVWDKGLVLFGLGLVMEVADFEFCEWFKGFWCSVFSLSKIGYLVGVVIISRTLVLRF